jgi:epoxyqueuosine reductase
MAFLKRRPPALVPLAFQRTPVSGNTINGVGEGEARLAVPVFHSTGRGDGRRPLEWASLDRLFNQLASWRSVLQVLRTLWQRRHYAGPVAAHRTIAGPPDRAAQWVKTLSRSLGADLVGITTVERDICYEGYPVPPFRYAISLGRTMRRGRMSGVPDVASAEETMRAYRLGSRTAIRVARAIRRLGWPAQAYADGEDILQIPLALRAGLGQLGKHGSVISQEWGSNLRLAAVLTDLPLALDAPVDIGVDDLCRTCRRCVEDCPPDAIGNEKVLVRGETKWYVDFDRCVPYFAVTEGCGICIQVCPWSEPGQGARLSEMLLAKRAR